MSTDVIIYLAGFAVIALAAERIGGFFAGFKFPLISGYLVAGILAGPFVLDLIPREAMHHLAFVDKIALAFIAFAAGSELYLKELRDRFKSIAWVTLGLTIGTFVLGTLTVVVLADAIPFLKTLPPLGKWAIGILAGAILVARSPSSAIAIVNELRAKGPLTHTVLGVTIVSDVIVILLFGLASTVAEALLTTTSFNLGFIKLLLAELSVSLLLGYLVGQLLRIYLAVKLPGILKILLILVTGYGVFAFSGFAQKWIEHQFNLEFLIEPLLVCMVASFWLTNSTGYRDEFLKLTQDVSPYVYIAFFTLTGAALALDILLKTWVIAVALLAVRMVAIFCGTLGGGWIAGDKWRNTRVSWMAYITQAGIGLGLAKEVSVDFPEWGLSFATMIIAVIVLNQIIGPPLFKWAIQLSGEAHAKSKGTEHEGPHRALIFGLEGQSLALARQLMSHGWEVRVASREANYRAEIHESDVKIVPIQTLSADSLNQLACNQADAVISLLSDDENLQICELIYEKFGTKTVIVMLHDRTRVDEFHALGALLVDPSTAMVNLMDHLVRSPVAASILLGMEPDQDMLDIELTNPNLQGLSIRNLRLPLDSLILSVRRQGNLLVSHGYTRLEIGDEITVMGSVKSLEEIELRLGR